MFSNWDQFDSRHDILNTSSGFQEVSENYIIVSYLIRFSFQLAYNQKKKPASKSACERKNHPWSYTNP